MRLTKRTNIHNGFHFTDDNFLIHGFYHIGMLKRYVKKNSSIGCSISNHKHGNKTFYI